MLIVLAIIGLVIHVQKLQIEKVYHNVDVELVFLIFVPILLITLIKTLVKWISILVIWRKDVKLLLVKLVPNNVKHVRQVKLIVLNVHQIEIKNQDVPV